MAASFIPVPGTEESLQTFENTIDGKSVHSEAVTPTDINGVPFSITNRFPTSLFGIEARHGHFARKGQTYMASTGRIELSAAGNLRAMMSNPSSSGRVVHLYKIISASSAAAAAYAGVFYGTTASPLTGQPTSAERRAGSMYLGKANSSAIIKADTDITVQLSGEASDLVLAASPGRTEIGFAPIIIEPGRMIGMNVAFAGAATVVLTVSWWEEDSATYNPSIEERARTGRSLYQGAVILNVSCFTNQCSPS